MPISIENNKIIISSPSTLEKVGEVKISSIEDVEKKLNVVNLKGSIPELSLIHI